MKVYIQRTVTFSKRNFFPEPEVVRHCLMHFCCTCHAILTILQYDKAHYGSDLSPGHFTPTSGPHWVESLRDGKWLAASSLSMIHLYSQRTRRGVSEGGGELTIHWATPKRQQGEPCQLQKHWLTGESERVKHSELKRSSVKHRAGLRVYCKFNQLMKESVR